MRAEVRGRGSVDAVAVMDFRCRPDGDVTASGLTAGMLTSTLADIGTRPGTWLMRCLRYAGKSKASVAKQVVPHRLRGVCPKRRAVPRSQRSTARTNRPGSVPLEVLDLAFVLLCLLA